MKITFGRARAESLNISTEVFMMLFNNSVVYSLASYQDSLVNEKIYFNDLIELARRADIPYTLFLAPKEYVNAQLKRKEDIILAGSTKDLFSMNSRGGVELRDIELILKDLLRKQTLLKKHMPESDNKLVGFLKRTNKPISEQATAIRQNVGIDLNAIRKLGKAKTFDYLVSLAEANNIFVTQSSRSYMPQVIQNHIKFSGMCIKDKTYPFIFMNNRDEDKSFEPEGRKVLTLTLLLVFMAKGRFSPVTYNEQSKSLINDEEYRIAEEVLMPEIEVRTIVGYSLNDIKSHADVFSITPSAMLMRLKRLNLIQSSLASQYLTDLRNEFNSKKPVRGGTPLATTAFKKYNGLAFSNRVFQLLDSGIISPGDARRILFLNKRPVSFLNEFRSKL